MLKRTIKYVDLDGKPLTEDFYFHYSTAEATELKVVLGDDIQHRIQALIEADNPREIVKIFKGIIADSIGKRSDNGKSFIKTDAYRDEFMGSDAYSEMLLWLLTDTTNMAAFVNGIFPENMNARVGELVAEREARGKTSIELPPQAPELKLPKMASTQSPLGIRKKLSDYTQAELIDMPVEQLIELKKFGE